MHQSELGKSVKYFSANDGGGERFSGGQSSPSFKSLQGEDDEESPFFRQNQLKEKAQEVSKEGIAQAQYGKIRIGQVPQQDQAEMIKNNCESMQNSNSFAEQFDDCIQQISRVCYIHHQEMFSAFCIPCQKLICCECHSLHIGHKVELIDQANLHCKEIMRSELISINSMIEEYVKLEEDLTSQKNELIEVYHQQQHEVDRCKRAILKFIENQSKMFLSQCQGLYNAKLECIVKEQRDLREILKELISRHQSIESHLHADSPLSFCKYFSQNDTMNSVKKNQLRSQLWNAFPMNKTILINETQGLKILENEFTLKMNEILDMNHKTSRQLSDQGKLQQQDLQQKLNQKSQKYPSKSFFQCFKPASNLSSVVTPLRNDPRKKISSGNSSKPSTLISHSAVSTAKSEYATADSRNRYEDTTGRQISRLIGDNDGTQRLAEVEIEEDDNKTQYEIMQSQDNSSLQRSYSQSSFLDRKKTKGKEDYEGERKGHADEEHIQRDLLSGQNLESINVENSKFLTASNSQKNRLMNFKKNQVVSSQPWKQQEILKEQLEQQGSSRDHEEASVLSSSSFKVDQQQSHYLGSMLNQTYNLKSFSQQSSPIRNDQNLFFKQNNKDLSAFVSSPLDNSSFQLPRLSLSPPQSKLKNSPNQLNSFLRQIREVPVLSQIEILRAHCSVSRSPLRMSPISSTQRRIIVTPKKIQKLTTVPIKKELILRNENESFIEHDQTMI